MTRLMIALSLAVSFTATPALAQDEAVEDSVVFETPDEIAGALVAPDGGQTLVPRGHERDSLITIRGHFMREMLSSVEDL